MPRAKCMIKRFNNKFYIKRERVTKSINGTEYIELRMRVVSKNKIFEVPFV